MKRIILLLAVISSISFTAVAQKAAYVDTQELMYQLPEAKEAQKAYEKYYEELLQQYSSMQEEYGKKAEEFDKNVETMSEVAKETKANEIRDLQRRIMEFESGIEEKIQKKQAQLFQPMLEKIQKAIDEVGKEGNYDYIYDASALLYAKDGQRINEKVKVKLGIK